MNTTHTRNNTFKLPKPKRKPQRQLERRRHIIYRRTKVKMKADSDQNYVRWSAKGMNCHPTILYPAKISFKLKEKERKPVNLITPLTAKI